MKSWPAIDVVVSGHPDLILAIVDDFAPTAVEERDGTLRIHFATPASRDAAQDALAAAHVDVAPLDIDDENWAERSQQDLTDVCVGRVVVRPPWVPPSAANPDAEGPTLEPRVVVVIQPSMGFGTGHHATTRLCLAALQTLDLGGKSVLDLGTGSGVLALAAARLGAARASGLDADPDAIQSARGNLALNPEVRHVTFEAADLTSAALPAADVVTANLTGALLIRAAALLTAAVRPGGQLILSGLLASEQSDVRKAFADAELVWQGEEDGWVGLVLRRTT